MCLLPSRPRHPHPPQCVLPSLHLKWQDSLQGLKSGDLHGSLASELSRCVFCLLGQLAAGLLSAFNDPSTGHVAGPPLACLAVSFSLSSKLRDCEKEDRGAPGGRRHPRALPQCREGGGAVWPLFHPTLSESLQSVVPRLNLPSPGPVRLHWALFSSFSLPSLPPHFRASAASPQPARCLPLSVSVTCRFRGSLCLSRPLSLLPPGWEEHCLLSPGLPGGCPRSQSRPPAGTWPPTRPARGSAWQPSALRPPGSGRSNLGASWPSLPGSHADLLEQTQRDNWGRWGLGTREAAWPEALACQHC